MQRQNAKWGAQNWLMKSFEAHLHNQNVNQCEPPHLDKAFLPKCKDSERSVGFVARVATQVGSPEVIGPDVAQGCCWSQVLQPQNTNTRRVTVFASASVRVKLLTNEKLALLLTIASESSNTNSPS